MSLANNYYRARYYDPEIGRFISEDPLRFEAEINFYAYCSNNPIICNDPMGLADIFRADISFGAQFGFDVKVGSVVNLNANFDFGSFSQSTEGPPVSTVR